MSEIDDVTFVNAGRLDTLIDPAFDESTHTWALPSQAGEHHRARVLIATDGAVPSGRGPDVLGLQPYLGVAVHGLHDLGGGTAGPA